MSASARYTILSITTSEPDVNGDFTVRIIDPNDSEPVEIQANEHYPKSERDKVLDAVREFYTTWQDWRGENGR